MTRADVLKLQEEYGFDAMQQAIESGTAWLDSITEREAIDALRSGACFLGNNETFDPYGKRIPTINEMEPGTMGSIENSINYYTMREIEWNLDNNH